MFYRIDGVADGEFGGLSSARFVLLCERLFAYRGAMRARAQQQADEDAHARPGPARGPSRPAGPAAARGRGEVREVGSSRAELRRDPVMASVIDF